MVNDPGATLESDRSRGRVRRSVHVGNRVSARARCRSNAENGAAGIGAELTPGWYPQIHCWNILDFSLDTEIQISGEADSPENSWRAQNASLSESAPSGAKLRATNALP